MFTFHTFKKQKRKEEIKVEIEEIEEDEENDVILLWKIEYHINRFIMINFCYISLKPLVKEYDTELRICYLKQNEFTKELSN